MSQNIWTRPKTSSELDDDARNVAVRLEQQRQLAGVRADYARMKKRETELAGLLGAMCLSSDIPQLIAADLELNMLRRVLETAPAEVREDYRPPVIPRADSAWEHARHRALAAEAEYIERHELPALEAKLARNEPLTARERGAWANFPGQERERHFNLIREQIAAKQARIVECRAKTTRG